MLYLLDAHNSNKQQLDRHLHQINKTPTSTLRKFLLTDALKESLFGLIGLSSLHSPTRSHSKCQLLNKSSSELSFKPHETILISHALFLFLSSGFSFIHPVYQSLTNQCSGKGVSRSLPGKKIKSGAKN